MDQILGGGNAEVLQEKWRQRRPGPALIGFTQDRANGGAANPEPAPLVAQDMSPAPRTRALVPSVPAVRNRPGARNDHDSRFPGNTGLERHERIVDHDRARVRADAPHDAAHDDRILRPIDAGNPETDRRRHNPATADRLGHDVVDDLLDVQLACGLKIGAARARLRDEGAVFVRELAHGLRAARIDAENMQHGHDGRVTTSAAKCS